VRTATDTEIRAAQKAANLAEEKGNRAGSAAEEAKRIIDGYGRTMGALQSDAARVQTQFLEMKQRLDAESANAKARADKGLKEATARLSRLEELVAKVSQDSQASRQAITSYKADLERIQTAAEAERKRFAENSEYSVVVAYTDKNRSAAEAATVMLTKAGFKASKLRLPVDKKELVPWFLIPEANLIVHTADAATKAAEVRGLIAPLVKIATIQEEAKGKAVRFLAGPSWGDEPWGETWKWAKEQVKNMTVYLVD
jgi:hypothetical protein